MNPSKAPNGEEVWDEDRWEEFLQRSDARAARYEELYETLVDHPERDRLIAREMGWIDQLDACAEVNEDCSVCDRRPECERYEMMQILSEAESLAADPDAEAMYRALDELETIPAYCCAHAFGLRMMAIVEMAGLSGEVREELRGAMNSSQLAAAQIAGGHGIGYEQDAISGNIASCKRARRSMESCVRHVTSLSARGLLAGARVRELHRKAEAVAREIADWIELLRYRRDNPWDSSWLQQ
jgi:hypothetical protein